ncbi:MAG TPA: 3-oxoacyl-ACP synthase [Desulfovibrio sp.]|jgi:3-oxoacyl-[acyl-carrier-protein] synthase-3|nr:3-oxoacyl-ACP synthase [Desulfovibrio sp.]HBR06832.1 3-oxoacyl-ACP synthase [Desulfovibrio sp.]
MTEFHIRGLGYHVPERILTNADLERMVETTDEWITSRTGIRERRLADGQSCSDLALPASLQALEQAGMAPEELTHILVATFTPDAYIPSAACVLEHRLGLSGRYAADISAACSGFVYALDAARAFIALRPESNVLVLGSEVVSSRTDYTDRGTCVLFGDGAGAAVVSATPGKGSGRFLDAILSSEGKLGGLLTVRGGASAATYKTGEPIRRDFFVEMQGREVFRHAVRSMLSVSAELLERNGFKPEDVGVFIPHQANMRIIEAVGQKIGVPHERIYVNVDRYGNTSAASIAIALAEARLTGFIKDGDLVLMATFGGGFTWGAALVQF